MSGLALHTIVFATDVSGNSAAALAWVEQLAKQHIMLLLLLPVLYSIFVLDLWLIRWAVEAPPPMRAEAGI
jgi:hypothetical protein